MQASYRFLRVFAAVAVILVPFGAAAQHSSELTPRDKSQIFIQHLVKILKIDPSQYRALVLEYEIGSALVEGNVVGSDFMAGDFIESALREIHPAYDKACELIAARKDSEARDALRALLSSTDPYLHAYAQLLLAELDFRAERYDAAVERAEETLRTHRMRVLADHRLCELIADSFQKEGQPLLAFAQYWILLVDYHELPPDVATRAKAQLAKLRDEVGLPLHTVAGWMNGVEKLLADEVTAPDPTQAEERNIVVALDKLIELQEAKERNACPGCGSCDGSCRGGCRNGRPSGSRSNSPAQVSALPGKGQGPVLLHGVSRGDPRSQWGLLRDRDAARALQSFRGKLPARHERLLREYYKALSREE